MAITDLVRRFIFGNNSLFLSPVFALIVQDSNHLTVSPVRNMKLNDDVLVVAVSPDGKHIAVALLDCTVKVRLIYLCWLCRSMMNLSIVSTGPTQLKRSQFFFFL